MAEVQIKKCSLRHEAILEYLIANPTASMGEVAAAFEVSQPWLSVIVNSDAFLALREERKDELFGTAIVQPLSAKLAALANDAVDRLHSKLRTENDVGTLTTTADKVLSRLGFNAPKPAGGSNTYNYVTQNNVSLAGPSPGVVENAKKMIGRLQADDDLKELALQFQPKTEVEQALEGELMNVQIQEFDQQDSNGCANREGGSLSLQASEGEGSASGGELRKEST